MLPKFQVSLGLYVYQGLQVNTAPSHIELHYLLYRAIG